MTAALVTVGLVWLAFLPYHAALFACYGIQTAAKPRPWLVYGVLYFINYLIFIIISLLSWPLPANWLLIAAMLTAEVRLAYRCRLLLSLFLGLSGALIGLAMTVISRSACALLLHLPLQSFDSVMSAELPQARSLSVSGGFVLAGLALFGLRPLLRRRIFRHLNHSDGNLKFALCLLAALYAYLLLNLLIYSVPANEAVLKLWGVKTGVCALIGYTLGLWYAVRESCLASYRARSALVRARLRSSARRGRQLEEQAYTDALTGCANRPRAERVLARLTRHRSPFALGFADLNGLKEVNDRLGHGMGDRYILAAARALRDALPKGGLVCRYGGDEFLLILPGGRPDEAERVIHHAGDTLRGLSRSAKYPFAMSLCHGVAASDENASPQGLLDLVDRRMYEQKIRVRAALKQSPDPAPAPVAETDGHRTPAHTARRDPA